MSKLKKGSTYLVDPLNKHGSKENNSISLIRIIEIKHGLLPFIPPTFVGEVLSPYGDRSDPRYSGSKGMIELPEYAIDPNDEIRDNERVVIRYQDNIPEFTSKELSSLKVAIHNLQLTNGDDGVVTNLKSILEKISFFSENVH